MLGIGWDGAFGSSLRALWASGLEVFVPRFGSIIPFNVADPTSKIAFRL